MASKKANAKKSDPKEASTEVAVKDTTGTALPAYLQGFKGPTGAEDISNEDVTIPRVKLAQALTPEVQDGSVAIGDMFLNVTGEVLAKAGEPLRFTPIVAGKEYILWHPERGEGILARGKPVKVGGVTKHEWDKQDETFEVKFKNGPKVKWETKKYVEDNGMHQFGTAIPDDPESMPAATKHSNFVVALPDFDDMIVAFSLSRSQDKRAKDLNAMLKMSKAPIFAREFTVKTTDERNNSGDEYKNYKFAPAGFVEDADRFEQFKTIHESFKEGGYTVDQSDEDDGGAVGEGTSI